MKEAHLSGNRLVTREQTKTRAFSITEASAPKGNGTPDMTNKIIEFLNVEKSARYLPGRGLTYCNIYAHDFARLMGAYIPRVWWTEKAIADKQEIATYGGSVLEMNANSLYAWFSKYGHHFGWREVHSMTEAQLAANDGKCVTAVAANVVSSKSGHIVMIVPETNDIKSVGAKGITVRPVQSQAGARNQKRFNSNWWSTGHKTLKCFVKD